MKRLSVLLLSLALLLACMSTQTAQSGLVSPVPKTESESVEVSLQHVPKEAVSTVPATDFPEETRPPEPAEAPKAQPT